MASTPDRTTIQATLDELATKLRAGLIADPPTPAKPLRRVEVGDSDVGQYARPYMTIVPTRAKLIGVMDNDKLVQVTATIRLVTDVTGANPHDAVLGNVGAVEDYFDGIIDTGVLDGAEGFDARTWSLEYPKGTAGARVAVASAEQVFIVKVERGQNRLPAV